jgi:stage II sporulation protein D
MRWSVLKSLLPNSGLKLNLLWLVFWALLTVPVIAAEIHVGLEQDVETITVGSSTPAQLVDGKGRIVGKISALQGFTASPISGGVGLAGRKAWQLMIQPQENGFVYAGDRWYRGQLKLLRTGGGITVINEVNLEDYLASVIGKEMYPTWPEEALKAQAVASRSYALFQQKRSKYKYFDVVDTVASQVYVGIGGEANSTQAAVKATAGEVLMYQGKVIEAAFHSASGGRTENSENVWMSAVPYLRGVPDFDQAAPVFQWSTTLTAGQLRQRIPGIGDILALIPVKTSPTGRIQIIKIQGSAGARVMKGAEVRRALSLRSTLFTVKPDFGLVAAGKPGVNKPIAFQINGRGSGHGLGMSQWGAYGMATQGKTYRDILDHYFQGATIKSIE